MADQIPAEVYEAAARAYDEPLRPIVVGTPAFRAAVDSAYAAGVAAGRAQAAADIRAASATRDDIVWLAGATWAAKIAGGEPR